MGIEQCEVNSQGEENEQHSEFRHQSDYSQWLRQVRSDTEARDFFNQYYADYFNRRWNFQTDEGKAEFLEVYRTYLRLEKLYPQVSQEIWEDVSSRERGVEEVRAFLEQRIERDAATAWNVKKKAGIQERLRIHKSFQQFARRHRSLYEEILGNVTEGRKYE